MLTREMVMRINQMITEGKMLWSQLMSKEMHACMHEYQCEEFVCEYWGLKD